jgi:histidine triad (HIT) family protein
MKTDPECIFCKIVAGEIPSTKILEDDSSVAFMDINPVAPGHALLICKEHYEFLADVPATTAGAVLANLPALARAVQQATGAEGYNVYQCNHAVAGQEVPHMHFHIIPRNPGDPIRMIWPAGQYADGEMDRVASAIRDNLQ